MSCSSEDFSTPDASTKAAAYFRSSPRYQYLRLLGHGAYGLVCAAVDTSNGQTVAIKRINQINSVLVARRTLRELKLLRHFRGHPNIISVLDLYKSDASLFDELYIAQELMDSDVSHLIATSKFPLVDQTCRQFVYAMLRGVKALHSADVLHRDLKPGNLLWRMNGELKICDFGLARGFGEGMDGRDMALTNYVATRWYRPPEILLYKANYGKPLDMWALGCIFAEMLNKKVFLPGQSGLEQLHLILQRLGTPPESVIAKIPSAKSIAYLRRLPRYERRPLRSRFPDAPEDALDLLDRLLKFDPAERITAEQALRHPYVAAFHDPAIEPDYPKFDFSFDARLQTLADLKNGILEELRLYKKAAIVPVLDAGKAGPSEMPHQDPLAEHTEEAEALAAIKPAIQRQSRFRHEH